MGKIRHKITLLDVLISRIFFEQVSADLFSISEADYVHFTHSKFVKLLQVKNMTSDFTSFLGLIFVGVLMFCPTMCFS
jgi:hypothetical protein